MTIIDTNNKSIKEIIKETLRLLPYGVGSNFLLPQINRITNYRRKRYVRVESKKIRTSIARGARNAAIFYDNFVSPPTYGDMFFSVMIARYLSVNGIRVKFYLIDSEHRHDWCHLSQTEADIFVDAQVNLIRSICNSPLVEVSRIAWNDYSENSLNISSDSIVPFVGSVKNRFPIYHSYFELLNQLLYNLEIELLDRTLLSYRELSPYIDIELPPSGAYVTVGCRYQRNWDEVRNLSENEFAKIFRYLKGRFPNHRVMIVSCSEGCEHFSELAKKHSFDCIFSKQYSSTFVGDGALILNSAFFFILKGGGISIIPQCSRVPYECYQKLAGELMWSKTKFASWQASDQLFFNTDLLPHDYL